MTMSKGCSPSFAAGNLRRHRGRAGTSGIYDFPGSPGSVASGETNRADRFDNPRGYPGLNGFEPGTSPWSRSGGFHETRHATEKTLVRKGAPLREED